MAGSNQQTSSNDVVRAPSQMDTIAGLMALIGGGGGNGLGTTTTTPGNIAPLEQLIAQLQGANYQGLLESIFQQASGSIPKLQAAYGNAVGARSGNNSATAAALQELLKATTIEAQGQIANQQLQNQQIQANAGNSIVNATKGTQSTTKANTMTGSGLGDLAAMIALLKGAEKLGIMPAFSKSGGATNTGANTAPAQAPATDAAAQPVQGAAPITSAPQMSFAPSTGFDLGAAIQPDFSYQPSPAEMDAGMSFADWYQPLDVNSILGQTAPEMSYAPEDWFPEVDVMSYF